MTDTPTDERVDELLADLDRALAIEPSPALAARARTRMGAATPAWLGWRWSIAAGAVIVLAGATVRRLAAAVGRAFDLGPGRAERTGPARSSTTSAGSISGCSAGRCAGGATSARAGSGTKHSAPHDRGSPRAGGADLAQSTDRARAVGGGIEGRPADNGVSGGGEPANRAGAVDRALHGHRALRG